MNKKAIFITSSPRKESNTSKIVSFVADIFREKNIEVKIVDVAQLNYATNGCVDCECCQKSEEFKCVIKDEASAILKDIPNYDFLIFATPIYFFGANAQLKLFLDRMQSLYKFGETTHTSCIGHMEIGLIATAGGGFNLGLNLLDETMKTMSKYTNVEYCSLLVPRAKQYTNILESVEIAEKAANFIDTMLKVSINI